MPFEANRTLAAALDQPVPRAVRNYEDMLRVIGRMAAELDRAAMTFHSIPIWAEPHDHSDTCEACTVIRNVQLRCLHDLSLLASQARVATYLHSRISTQGTINHATAEDLLSVSLTARAVLDNLVRSCALFIRHDIRVYNKYLAESLTSMQKLVWTTLPHSIDESARPLLDTYRSLTGSQRNEGTVFADPFATFARKIEFLRGLSQDEEFNKLFGAISELYGALSDLVHGGIAALAIASPKGPQIVMGSSIRYTPYTYQVAELLGVSLITSLQAFANLYVPALIQSLAKMDGASTVTEKLMAEHTELMHRIKGATF